MIPKVVLTLFVFTLTYKLHISVKGKHMTIMGVHVDPSHLNRDQNFVFTYME